MTDIDSAGIRSRVELAGFIRLLVEDFRRHPGAWENADLGSYLGAMSAWIEDMDGYYANKGETVPDRPEWSTIAEILAASRVYE